MTAKSHMHVLYSHEKERFYLKLCNFHPKARNPKNFAQARLCFIHYCTWVLQNL